MISIIAWDYQSLLNVHVTAPGMWRNWVGKPFADQIISALVHAGHFHINGSGVRNSEFAVTISAGWKKNCTPGKRWGSFLTQSLMYMLVGCRVLLSLNEDFGRNFRWCRRC